MGVCIAPPAAAAAAAKPKAGASGTRRVYRRIDIRLVPFNSYPCAILYFTGSDMFNRDMRIEALKKGLTLNEYCIKKNEDGAKPLVVRSEQDVFKHIGMAYVKPTNRSV